jgi:hypothetical protein
MLSKRFHPIRRALELVEGSHFSTSVRVEFTLINFTATCGCLAQCDELCLFLYPPRDAQSADS